MVHAGSLESTKEVQEFLEEIAESNSGILSALQTFQVLHSSMEHSWKHIYIAGESVDRMIPAKTRAKKQWNGEADCLRYQYAPLDYGARLRVLYLIAGLF